LKSNGGRIESGRVGERENRREGEKERGRTNEEPVTRNQQRGTSDRMVERKND